MLTKMCKRYTPIARNIQKSRERSRNSSTELLVHFNTSKDTSRRVKTSMMNPKPPIILKSKGKAKQSKL